MKPLPLFGLSLAVAASAIAAPTAWPAQSAARGTLVLRAQQSTPLRGMELATLTFEPSGVTLSRNSNFLDGAAVEVELGLLTTDAKRFASDRARIQSLVDAETGKAPVKTDAPVNRPPDALRVFAGGTEVLPGSVAGRAILDAIRKASAYSGWRSLDSLKIKAESMANIQLERRHVDSAVWEPVDPSACTQEAPGLVVCKVLTYGWAYLKPKK